MLTATQEPLSTIALSQKSGVPAWKTIPSWAVVGTADHVILPAEQLAMARQAHAHITEVRAPHLSMISDPGVVTQVIILCTPAATSAPRRSHRSRWMVRPGGASRSPSPAP